MGKSFNTGLLTNGIAQDSSNNVGIGGAANASYKLAVTGAGLFSGALTASTTFTLDGTKKVFLRSNQGTGGGLISGSAIGAMGNFSIYSDDGVAGDILGMYYWNGGTYRSALQFANVSSGSSNLLLMKDGGNVGIGTSSPSGILQVQNVQDGVSGKNLTLAYNGTYYAEYTEKSIRAYNNELIIGTGTGGAERMRINSTGQVGIGTSSFTGFNSTDLVLRVQQSSGISAVQAISGDSGAGVWLYSGANSSDFPSIIFKRDLRFGSATDLGTGGYTERMRITSGGQTLIYNTASLYSNVRLSVKQTTGDATAEIWSSWAGDQSTSALYVIKYDNVNTTSQVFQRFVIGNGSFTAGQINANGANQAAFGSWSDIRLKENVENLPSQLSNIMALRPVEFDYKDGSGHQIGFIAQEMQEIYSDAVGEDSEGFLTITGWSKTEARLVKALQEAVNKIDELSAKVTALENR